MVRDTGLIVVSYRTVYQNLRNCVLKRAFNLLCKVFGTLEQI